MPDRANLMPSQAIVIEPRHSWNGSGDTIAASMVFPRLFRAWHQGAVDDSQTFPGIVRRGLRFFGGRFERVVTGPRPGRVPVRRTGTDTRSWDVAAGSFGNVARNAWMSCSRGP